MRTESILNICGGLCLLIGYIILFTNLGSIVPLISFSITIGFFISVLIVSFNKNDVEGEVTE